MFKMFKYITQIVPMIYIDRTKKERSIYNIKYSEQLLNISVFRLKQKWFTSRLVLHLYILCILLGFLTLISFIVLAGVMKTYSAWQQQFKISQNSCKYLQNHEKNIGQLFCLFSNKRKMIKMFRLTPYRMHAWILF